MANKINTLDHIDGKLVKWSTITSQHPEVFVENKRNTGELIVSTDTSVNGMHHIYVGGEHIACGYGFSSTVVTGDLTYVQQTYNGIFTYFHNNDKTLFQAYSYQTELNNDMIEEYTSGIINNSYKNLVVDPFKNKIKINDTISYQLTLNSYKFSLNEIMTKSLYFNNTFTYNTLLITSETPIYKFINLTSTFDLKSNFKNVNTYVSDFSLHINLDNTEINKETTYNTKMVIDEFTGDSYRYLSKYYSYLISTRSIGTVDGIAKIGKIMYDDMVSSNNLSIFASFSYDMQIKLKYPETNNSYTYTNSVKYLWRYPIKFGTIINNIEDTQTDIFIDYKRILILDKKETSCIVNTNNTNCKIFVAIPKLTLTTEYNFYLSENTDLQGLFEGGFSQYKTDDIYDYYCTELFNIYNENPTDTKLIPRVRVDLKF